MDLSKIQAISRAGLQSQFAGVRPCVLSVLADCLSVSSTRAPSSATSPQNKHSYLSLQSLQDVGMAPRCHVYVCRDSFLLGSSQQGDKNKHVRSYAQNWNVNGHTPKSWDLILERNSRKVPHSTRSIWPWGRLPTRL